MKKISILLFFLLCLSQLKAQQTLSDTVGHYYHNHIIYNDWKEFKKLKTFEGRIIQFQTQYPNGRTAREFSRYDDAHFLLTEYYEFPDTSIQFHGSTWGVVREGMVQIIPSSRRDTIVLFDPETYEEHLYFDSLLLPVGTWTYYFPNGNVRQTGNFTNFLREGKWLTSNEIGLPEKTDQYALGKLTSTQIHNIILHGNTDSTRIHIKGIWAIVKPSNSEGNIDPKLLNYMYLVRTEYVPRGTNSYTFADASKLEFVSSPKPEGNKKVETGSWKLPAHNLLEITLDRQTERFLIEYVSDRSVVLKKQLE